MEIFYCCRCERRIETEDKAVKMKEGWVCPICLAEASPRTPAAQKPRTPGVRLPEPAVRRRISARPPAPEPHGRRKKVLAVSAGTAAGVLAAVVVGFALLSRERPPGHVPPRAGARPAGQKGKTQTFKKGVSPAPGPPVGIFETRVASGKDDAEERPGGSTNLTSSDLELIRDRVNQVVGIRFTNVELPRGATVARAYVQFQVDETGNINPCSLTIRGEAADDAASFTGSKKNVSSRPTTTASVSWSPPNWTAVGEAGLDQRTPDIAPLIKEIVGRPGWRSGNALVIIIAGTGRRTARAYNRRRPGGAPLLHVERASGSL